MLSSGPRVTDRLPGRNADSRRTICSPRGSATVEAAVVIPIFMIALFSLAYIIKVFMAYNVMQSALQRVARSISNASYYYHVSGLKDYSDELDRMGQGASDELKSQTPRRSGNRPLRQASSAHGTPSTAFFNNCSTPFSNVDCSSA